MDKRPEGHAPKEGLAITRRDKCIFFFKTWTTSNWKPDSECHFNNTHKKWVSNFGLARYCGGKAIAKKSEKRRTFN